METRVVERNGTVIAVVDSAQVLLVDVQSALDLIATLRYETGCDGIVLSQASIAPDFFKLSSGLAGELLQKFINYQMKLGIVGDFSIYTSKPLRDFIYESNSGNHICFVATVDEAIGRLTAVR